MSTMRIGMPLARAARGLATGRPGPPPTPVVGKANLAPPPRSNLQDGMFNGGVLAGTLFVCLIPGIWAMLTPKPAGGH